MTSTNDDSGEACARRGVGRSLVYYLGGMARLAWACLSHPNLPSVIVYGPTRIGVHTPRLDSGAKAQGAG